MIQFIAMQTGRARAFQAGAPDAYGHAPERAVSDGPGHPCRHCLRDISRGQDMLILAYRPFGGLHPYAETGPVFLCAAPCPRGGGAEVPQMLTTSPDYLIRGYSDDDRIVYGTGAVVAARILSRQAGQILTDPRVAYVHVRSAHNNCYQLRIGRAQPGRGDGV